MTFLDTLKPEFSRLDLDFNKAKRWFSNNPFMIDVKLSGLDESISREWYGIFSHNKTAMQIINDCKNSKVTEMLEVSEFFFKRTIFGLLKICYESTGTWVDVVQRDKIYRFAWFHHVIANELDHAFDSWSQGKPGKYVLLSVPPQSGKSTLAAAGLVPMILGNYPSSKGVFGSYNSTYGATVLKKDTMSIVESPAYTKLFGRIFNKNLDHKAKKELAAQGIAMPQDSAQIKGTTKSGRIFAGSLKQLTGNPAQFILVDDPIPNAAVGRNDVEVAKISSEYDASAMSRARDNTLIAVLQTRWNSKDVIGYTIDKINRLKEKGEEFNKEIVNLCFRAFYQPEDDFGYDFRKNLDDMLWADVASSAYINAKYGDKIMFEALYQQNPVPSTNEEERVIKPDWINIEPYESFPKSYDKIIISVDTSYNDKKTSDKAAFGVFGILGNKYYLVDLFYERASFLSGLNALDELIHKYPDYHSVLIELKANGQAYFETLEAKYSGIVGINATESKRARVESISNIIEEGRLILPDTSKGLQTKEQLVSFTGMGKHEKDDLVDIVAMLIRWHDPQFGAAPDYALSDVKVASLPTQNAPKHSPFGVFTSTSAISDVLKRRNSPFSWISKI